MNKKYSTNILLTILSLFIFSNEVRAQKYLLAALYNDQESIQSAFFKIKVPKGVGNRINEKAEKGIIFCAIEEYILTYNSELQPYKDYFLNIFSTDSDGDHQYFNDNNIMNENYNYCTFDKGYDIKEHKEYVKNSLILGEIDINETYVKIKDYQGNWRWYTVFISIFVGLFLGAILNHLKIFFKKYSRDKKKEQDLLEAIEEQEL